MVLVKQCTWLWWWSYGDNGVSEGWGWGQRGVSVMGGADERSCNLDCANLKQHRVEHSWGLQRSAALRAG